MELPHTKYREHDDIREEHSNYRAEEVKIRDDTEGDEEYHKSQLIPFVSME